MAEPISRRDFIKLAGMGMLAGFLPRLVTAPRLILNGVTPEEIDFLSTHEVSWGDTSRPIILMTYDDGGTADNLAIILTACEENAAKASFFVTGEWLSLTANQRIAAEIVAHGHVLGCHGFSHTPFTALSGREIDEQLTSFLRLVDETVPGYKLRYFRPPYGDRSDFVRRKAAEYGLQSVMWAFESGGSTDSTFSRLVDHAENGLLVLSHSTRYYDIHQSGQILSRLRELNYSLESLATGLEPQDYWWADVKPQKTRFTDPHRQIPK